MFKKVTIEPKLLEYFYKPFEKTCLVFYHLLLLLYYLITNKKGNPEPNTYNDGKTINEYKIKNSKIYISKNFLCVIKLIFLMIVLWSIYQIILVFGFVEIDKLFSFSKT